MNKSGENPASVYLIACSREERAKRREQLLNRLEPLLFGEEAASNEAELNRLFRRLYGIDPTKDFVEGDSHYDEYVAAQQAITEGLSVYLGKIGFRSDEFAQIAVDVWDSCEQEDPENFREINTALEE